MHREKLVMALEVLLELKCPSLVNIYEAAEILGISTEAVRDKIVRNELQIKTSKYGERTGFDKRDLLNILEQEEKEIKKSSRMWKIKKLWFFL